MSEREIRQKAKAYLDGGLCRDCYEAECGRPREDCTCSCHDEGLALGEGLLEALSADPDLVVVLRWCYERGALSALRGHGDAANSFYDVTREIEKTVRLTDDGGWEWVEKE